MAALTEGEFIWKNGELIPWAEATTHVLSHSLHYGSGVFEGIRCYKGKNGSAVFRLEDHMERLMNGCKIAQIPCDYTAEDAVKACR